MPGVPLICVSMAVVVVCSTCLRIGTDELPDTETVGGVISGYWRPAGLIIEINLQRPVQVEMTIAVTGLRIRFHNHGS